MDYPRLGAENLFIEQSRRTTLLVLAGLVSRRSHASWGFERDDSPPTARVSLNLFLEKTVIKERGW